MSQSARRIHSSVEFELEAVQRTERRGASGIATRHLECAHVPGQTATVEHVRVHGRMLGWAGRQRKVAEAVGQVWRIAGAAAATGIGWIPDDNTGGFRPLPIPPGLKRVLDDARR